MSFTLRTVLLIITTIAITWTAYRNHSLHRELTRLRFEYDELAEDRRIRSMLLEFFQRVDENQDIDKETVHFIRSLVPGYMDPRQPLLQQRLARHFLCRSQILQTGNNDLLEELLVLSDVHIADEGGENSVIMLFRNTRFVDATVYSAKQFRDEHTVTIEDLDGDGVEETVVVSSELSGTTKYSIMPYGFKENQN